MNRGQPPSMPKFKPTGLLRPPLDRHFLHLRLLQDHLHLHMRPLCKLLCRKKTNQLDYQSLRRGNITMSKVQRNAWWPSLMQSMRLPQLCPVPITMHSRRNIEIEIVYRIWRHGHNQLSRWKPWATSRCWTEISKKWFNKKWFKWIVGNNIFLNRGKQNLWFWTTTHVELLNFKETTSKRDNFETLNLMTPTVGKYN